MLPPNYLINRISDIEVMYSDLHTSILESIAQHIADTLRATGIAAVIPTTAYEIERLNAAGMLREDIVKRIAAINHTSPSAIRQMFEDAAVQTRVYDDRIYAAAGLEPISIMQSPAMLQILEAGISKTMGSIERLTGTIAINAESRFEELLNVGYNKVASGAMSYTKAIEDTVDELAREDIKTMDYASGRAISIEAGVRRAVLTGINQTAGHITHQTALGLNVDLVRTSAHLGARNTGEGFRNHESWQGQIFSLKGKNDKYEDFYAACGYGDVQGIYGANCRHSHGPFFERLSPETYSQADLDEFADKTVTYNGDEIPYYDATQIQRGLERNLRNWKRRRDVKESAGVDASIEKIKVREWSRKLKDFTEQTGLKRQPPRERIAKTQ